VVAIHSLEFVRATLYWREIFLNYAYPICASYNGTDDARTEELDERTQKSKPNEGGLPYELYVPGITSEGGRRGEEELEGREVPPFPIIAFGTYVTNFFGHSYLDQKMLSWTKNQSRARDFYPTVAHTGTPYVPVDDDSLLPPPPSTGS
jgi:hypothetical protein